MSIKLWRHFDPILVAAALLLTTIGVVMVYAALSSPKAHAVALSATLHEASYAILGLVLLVAVCFLDYRVFRTLFWPLFIGNALLLLAVLAAGRASHGAQRWLSLGFFPFQPSELGKLLLILTLAKILADRDQQITKLRIVLLALLIAAIPAALVYPQPDLGTAVVYLAIWLGMTMAAGMRVRHLALLVVAGIIGSDAHAAAAECRLRRYGSRKCKRTTRARNRIRTRPRQETVRVFDDGRCSAPYHFT